MSTENEIEMHELLAPLFEFKKYNFKVMYGGRGGLKTWGAARALIAIATNEKKRILCAREFQGSIRDSVHAVLKDQIELMGLEDQWTIGNDRIVNNNNGSYFIFEGLKNNAKTIKGKERIDFCWCEEAESISQLSWDYLIPTIQRVENSEIWVTFNPSDELDPTYKMFVTNPRDKQWTLETNYTQNHWLPQSFIDGVEQMKRENYNDYLHYYMGQPNTNYEDALIQPIWVNAAVDAHKKLNWDVLGAHITSFDPADTGDNKAMCTRHSMLIEHISDWPNDELPEAILKAYQQAFDSRSEQMVYDADGMGVAMKINLDRNEKEYRTQSIPFHGGSKVHEPDNPYPAYDPNSSVPMDRVLRNKDVFRNLRAQYYCFLRDRFQNTYNAVVKGQWIDPEKCISLSSEIDKDTFKRLRQELTGVRRKPGESGSRITLMSKQDMKSKGLKSPNLADSLMMVFASEEVYADITLNIKSQWS